MGAGVLSSQGRCGRAPDSILRVPSAKANHDLVFWRADGGEGFAIATLTSPPTYDPGGPTALVDDFVLSNDNLWNSLGQALLDEITREAKARGAVGIIVVCVAKDAGKPRLIAANDLSRICEWHQKRL